MFLTIFVCKVCVSTPLSTLCPASAPKTKYPTGSIRWPSACTGTSASGKSAWTSCPTWPVPARRIAPSRRSNAEWRTWRVRNRLSECRADQHFFMVRARAVSDAGHRWNPPLQLQLTVYYRIVFCESNVWHKIIRSRLFVFVILWCPPVYELPQF